MLVLALTFTATVLLALLVLGSLAWPMLQAVRERQRVALEARLAQYQLRRVTYAGMLRLLEEARQAAMKGP